ncbi:MAG: PAS domain-containing hybrid sensor histidine kinase/response regulator [Isosphaeraceae bacterium]
MTTIDPQKTSMDPTGELLAAWVDSARDYAILLVDPEGRVASWNVGAERILGYSESEAMGLSIEVFFTHEDRQKGVPGREMVEATSRGRASDDRWHVRKDGSRFWCSGVLMRVQDESGEPRGFVKIMRDLTERKLMEERLRARTEELVAVDRLRNEFLSMLSHELRNPLVPILTGAYILRDLLPPADSVARETRDMIERQTIVLKRIVDDLLDVSRIALNRIELRLASIDLVEIGARAVESVRALIETRRHTLTVAADPPSILLSGDPVRLEQAIAALLSNAARFTEPGGRIELTLGLERDTALVEVRDDGPGLSPEMLTRVFEMFVQADQGLARSPGGLGIGLTLARHLVRLHGGSLEGSSGGPGQGAVFTIRLPTGAAAEGWRTPGADGQQDVSGTPTDPERSERPASAGPSGVGSEIDAGGPAPASPLIRRILLVDDNADAARSTEILLRRSGYAVELACDGQEALEKAFRLRPDLVILDVGLPTLDGYSVARELRRQTNIPLVALSGYAAEESTSLLFDAYLVKPVEPDELVRVLARRR